MGHPAQKGKVLRGDHPHAVPRRKATVSVTPLKSVHCIEYSYRFAEVPYMDVVLDSNAYLADPRMEGVAFHSLFDYLKKTTSQLILPKVVLDEVVSRYPENLQSCIDQATPKLEKLRSAVLVAKVAELPVIDVRREAMRLKARLSKPSPKIKVTILNNYGDVSMDEVVRRGVQRVPPSKKGEELRDVILWLMVLAYVKASKTPTAFVSSDGHFRNENALHPFLAQEIRDSTAPLHFYVSIDDFIKANAPPPRELTEDEALGLCERLYVLDRFEIEARRVFQRRWADPSSVEIADRSLKLLRGALYDVGPNSQYGEMEFRVELRLRVTSRTQVISQAFSTPFSASIPMKAPQQAWYQSTFETPFITNQLILGKPVIAKATNWSYNSPTTFPNAVDWIGSTDPVAYPTFHEITADFIFSGTIVISLRLVSGSVKEKETERFEPEQLAQLASTSTNRVG
jgi:hypothetical protein